VKCITLLTLMIMLLCSSIGLTEQGKTYVYSDILTANFPEDWTTKTFGRVIRSISPTKLPTVAITIFPISFSKMSLDERIINWQNYVTTKKI